MALKLLTPLGVLAFNSFGTDVPDTRRAHSRANLVVLPGGQSASFAGEIGEPVALVGCSTWGDSASFKRLETVSESAELRFLPPGNRVAANDRVRNVFGVSAAGGVDSVKDCPLEDSPGRHDVLSLGDVASCQPFRPLTYRRNGVHQDQVYKYAATAPARNQCILNMFT